MNRLIRAFAVLGFVFISFSSFASQICTGTLRGLASEDAYALKIGDVFEAEFQGGASEAVHFLGASRLLDGQIGGFLFFNPHNLEIHHVPVTKMSIFDSDNKPVLLDKLEPVVRSINQQGGTCAAYGIFNCMHQLYASGHLGNGTIVNRMATEAERQRLSVRITMEYYGDNTHVGAESEVAKELGYVVSNLDSSSGNNLAKSIRRSSELGWPMLVRFDVGKKMSQTPYTITNHENDIVSSRRLWTPSDGRGSAGGHQIVFLRTFTDLQGNEWIVVIDSNWQGPRLWSIQELAKVRSAGIRGWTVWQKEPTPSPLPLPPISSFNDQGVSVLSYPEEF